MSRLLGKVVLREGSALVPRGIVHHPKNAALSLFYVLKCFTGLKVFLLLGLAAPGAGAAQGIPLPSAGSGHVAGVRQQVGQGSPPQDLSNAWPTGHRHSIDTCFSSTCCDSRLSFTGSPPVVCLVLKTPFLLWHNGPSSTTASSHTQ